MTQCIACVNFVVDETSYLTSLLLRVTSGRDSLPKENLQDKSNSFLRVGLRYHSWHQTNSIKTLKETESMYWYANQTVNPLNRTVSRSTAPFLIHCFSRKRLYAINANSPMLCQYPFLVHMLHIHITDPAGLIVLAGTCSPLPIPIRGSGYPSNTWFLWQTRVYIPNGISIGSAVFKQLTDFVPNTRINTYTILCVISVASMYSV